jgi:hypothetical protein
MSMPMSLRATSTRFAKGSPSKPLGVLPANNFSLS